MKRSPSRSPAAGPTTRPSFQQPNSWLLLKFYQGFSPLRAFLYWRRGRSRTSVEVEVVNLPSYPPKSPESMGEVLGETVGAQTAISSHLPRGGPRLLSSLSNFKAHMWFSALSKDIHIHHGQNVSYQNSNQNPQNHKFPVNSFLFLTFSNGPVLSVSWLKKLRVSTSVNRLTLPSMVSFYCYYYYLHFAIYTDD